MKVHDSFPRYVDFDPKVPVWCVTPERPGCIHRFFDTSPISPSGRYLALFQLPFEDRQPQPGDTGHVCIVDLETGRDRVVADTRGWEPQMGANINWGATDEQLFFNDMDSKTWQPFAWKLNPLTGDKIKMTGTVYHASPDGKWLISANMTTNRRTQPGYGVRIPDEHARRNIGPVDDDGFYITNTETGQCRLFASTKELLEKANPAVLVKDRDNQEIYGFHSKFNPQGDKLMLSLRWYEKTPESAFDAFRRDHSAVHFAWITTDLDRSFTHCAVGPEEWCKRGHHATWFPDGKRISMNLNIDREVLRFVEVNYDGSNLHKILEKVQGSGHPTVTPDGSHILTDTYTHESLAFGDGTTPIRWVDLKEGTEETIIRINTATGVEDGVMRVDPHPAWDRTWRYVTFNAFVDGTRRVFVADMKRLIS
jgi:hypothetical protein